jgi:hypothetical protein
MDIDHGTGPGPIRVDWRRGDLQRSMGSLVGGLVGVGGQVGLVGWLGVLLCLLEDDCVCVLVFGWVLGRVGWFGKYVPVVPRSAFAGAREHL